tara:strand:+ start:63 stop:176 length:114 start_codon:yes stop_codon:yes gene_type:complete
MLFFEQFRPLNSGDIDKIAFLVGVHAKQDFESFSSND